MTRPVRKPLRTFEHFPEKAVCPGCLTNDDGECFLIPIVGTVDDGICQATPFHTGCIDLAHQKEHGLLFQRLDGF